MKRRQLVFCLLERISDYAKSLLLYFFKRNLLAFQHLQINSDVLFKSSFLLWCVIVSSFIPRKKSYFTVSNLLFLQCIGISMRVAQHFYEQICIFMTMRLILFAAYLKLISLPASFYLFKVNNRDTRKRCYICSKLTIKTPE